MRDDDLAATGHVRRSEQRADVVERHPQVPEPADHLSGYDLTWLVVPIAGPRVDLGGVQHADIVVVAQRLDAEVRHLGEVTDRDPGPHGTDSRAPRRWPVKHFAVPRALRPPAGSVAAAPRPGPPRQPAGTIAPPG